MMTNGLKVEVTLLYLFDPWSFSSRAHFHKEFADLVEGKMKKALSAMKMINSGLKKVKIQTIARTGSPVDDIVNFAEGQGMDLMILGKTFFSDPYERSIAFKIISHANCPVISWVNEYPPTPIGNIILPLDETDATLQKVPLARHLATSFNARVILFSDNKDFRQERDSKEQLAAVAKFLREYQVKSTMVLETTGNLITGLTNYTNTHKVDLLMIMKRPSYELKDLFISSKALKVLQNSTVPVLTMRPLGNFKSAGL